jgi:hypothetical protein
MTAEPALSDEPFRSPAERHSHMLQLDNRLRSFLDEELDGILVGKVIATLDGVEHVGKPVIGFHVAKRCGNPTLGGPRVGPRREHLGQYAATPCGLRFQRCAHTGKACADNYRVISMEHVY